MLRREGSEGTPRGCAGDQSLGVFGGAIKPGHTAQHGHVAGGKGVWLAQGAQGDVVRRPGADATDRAELGDLSVKVAARPEHGGIRRGDRAQGGTAGAGHAERVKIGGQNLGLGWETACVRGQGCKLTAQRAGAADGDLLANGGILLPSGADRTR